MTLLIDKDRSGWACRFTSDRKQAGAPWGSKPGHPSI